MVETSKKFVPVFIDTLTDLKTTRRFKESFGSYPVLRVHDLEGREIGGRLNTNPTAGRVPAKKVVRQMEQALERFKNP